MEQKQQPHIIDVIFVLALFGAFAFSSVKDPLGGQLPHQQADRRHVGHGVQGTHLVEVDLLQGHAVDPALGLRQQPVDRQHVVFHVLRKVQMILDEMLDPVQPVMLVMVVVVLMLVTVLVMVVFLMLIRVMVLRPNAFPLGGRCQRFRR